MTTRYGYLNSEKDLALGLKIDTMSGMGCFFKFDKITVEYSSFWMLSYSYNFFEDLSSFNLLSMFISMILFM